MSLISGLSENDPSISMAEKLFLLVLDNKKGKTFYRSAFALRYAVIASIIYELEMKKKIMFENEKLVVKDKTPTGEYFQSLILEKIVDLSKDKKLNYWITKLSSNYKDIKPQIYENLINKGHIKRRKDKNDVEIKNRYVIWKDTLFRRLRSKLDKVLLEGKTADDESRILASLIWSCRATGNLYRDKVLRSKAKAQVKMLGDDEKYAKVVRKSINAIRVNVLTGVVPLIIPVVKAIF